MDLEGNVFGKRKAKWLQEVTIPMLAISAMRECHIKGITVGPRCGRCDVTFGVKSWVIFADFFSFINQIKLLL